MNSRPTHHVPFAHPPLANEVEQHQTSNQSAINNQCEARRLVDYRRARPILIDEHEGT